MQNNKSNKSELSSNHDIYNPSYGLHYMTSITATVDEEDLYGTIDNHESSNFNYAKINSLQQNTHNNTNSNNHFIYPGLNVSNAKLLKQKSLNDNLIDLDCSFDARFYWQPLYQIHMELGYHLLCVIECVDMCDCVSMSVCVCTCVCVCVVLAL